MDDLSNMAIPNLCPVTVSPLSQVIWDETERRTFSSSKLIFPCRSSQRCRSALTRAADPAFLKMPSSPMPFSVRKSTIRVKISGT